MLNELFGKYLVEKGKLSKAQYQIVSEKHENARVKLGLIAVEENLLTKEQADELNKLQSQMDKRFGDLAVEKGYLTDEQVSMLLKKQGNAYLQFVQTISESGFMTIPELDESLKQFTSESGYSTDELNALKSGDPAKIVPLFVDKDNKKLQDILAIILRMVTRFISTGYYIDSAKKVSSFDFNSIAGQSVVGDDVYTIGFADSSNGNSFTHFASLYSGKTLTNGSAEAFDAIGEFSNCINGLFISSEAGENSNIDMVPPYLVKNGSMKGDLYIVPLFVKGLSLSIVIALNNTPEIQGEKIAIFEELETKVVNENAKKILIIDDSRMSRSVLRDTLENAGYCVVGEAINGVEGVKAFMKLKPDLCTMDITMPVMDGIEALKEIRKLDPKAKIVMVSAAGMKAKIVEAIKAGASEFIAKPYEKEKVEKIVADILG